MPMSKESIELTQGKLLEHYEQKLKELDDLFGLTDEFHQGDLSKNPEEGSIPIWAKKMMGESTHEVIKEEDGDSSTVKTGILGADAEVRTPDGSRVLWTAPAIMFFRSCAGAVRGLRS